MKLSRLLPMGVLAAVAGVMALMSSTGDSVAQESKKKALRGLMLTGGCCHDYDKQKEILATGLGSELDIEWKVVQEGGKGTKHQFDLLKKEGWEKDYDFVLYNICFAHEEDAAYIDSITEVHGEGLAAVSLHCTTHTYHWKTKTDSWEQFLGVTSPRHGKHHPITVKTVEAGKEHPVMAGVPAEWVTPQGELYHIDKVWPSATVLAEGTIDGGKKTHPVAWANSWGKGRVFGTTIGHHNETMADENYLKMVANGIRWAVEGEK